MHTMSQPNWLMHPKAVCYETCNICHRTDVWTSEQFCSNVGRKIKTKSPKLLTCSENTKMWPYAALSIITVIIPSSEGKHSS